MLLMGKYRGSGSHLDFSLYFLTVNHPMENTYISSLNMPHKRMINPKAAHCLYLYMDPLNVDCVRPKRKIGKKKSFLISYCSCSIY